MARTLADEFHDDIVEPTEANANPTVWRTEHGNIRIHVDAQGSVARVEHTDDRGIANDVGPAKRIVDGVMRRLGISRSDVSEAYAGASAVYDGRSPYSVGVEMTQSLHGASLIAIRFDGDSVGRSLVLDGLFDPRKLPPFKINETEAIAIVERHILCKWNTVPFVVSVSGSDDMNSYLLPDAGKGIVLLGSAIGYSVDAGIPLDENCAETVFFDVDAYTGAILASESSGTVCGNTIKG